MKRICAFSVAAAVVLAASSAVAEEAPPAVQWNAGLDLGVAGIGSRSFWQQTDAFVGARADALFGRHGEGTWGYGPVAGVSTYAFRDISAQLGGSLLIPVHEYLPIVLSAGGYARRADGVTEPGLFGTFFWGTRSYNYQASYAMVAGLLVEARVGVGDPRERTVIVAAHIDGEILVLPALLLVNAFRLVAFVAWLTHGARRRSRARRRIAGVRAWPLSYRAGPELRARRAARWKPHDAAPVLAWWVSRETKARAAGSRVGHCFT